jgi:hypothetical protein
MRLFDLHCDTLYECRKSGSGLYENKHHVDLLRGMAFDAYAQVFAVWLPDTIKGLRHTGTRSYLPGGKRKRMLNMYGLSVKAMSLTAACKAEKQRLY